jgi:hypothetical protein
MARRRTIGINPLDAVVPEPQPSAPEPPPRVHKERLTVHLPVGLIDQVKNAVYWTPGLTLAALAERAMRRELAELEQERGGPFPSRKEELRGGRPLK